MYMSQSPEKDDLTFNTTPNLLTLLRMAFVPVVVGLLFLREPKWDVIAALTFTAASITDYFDGYLARIQKLETVYGIDWIDPLPFLDTYDYTYDGVMRAFEDSQQRLGFDYLDVLLVHDAGRAWP